MPGSGTEIGITDGDATFTYDNTHVEISAEQELAPVDVFTSAEMGKLEMTVKEQTLNTLKQAFDNIGFDHQSAGDGVYAGGGTTVLAPKTQCVVLTSMQRNAPTKFLILVLYKVYKSTPFAMPVGKKSESKYKVTFNCLADLSRNAGDRLFQYRWEL